MIRTLIALELAGAGVLAWVMVWLWVRWLLAMADRWLGGEAKRKGDRDGDEKEEDEG